VRTETRGGLEVIFWFSRLRRALFPCAEDFYYVNDPLDPLIVRMCAGDAEALEHVFLAYEPKLHQWVSRHLTDSLRSKLDPSDIILATWVDVLRHFRSVGWRFTDANHFRRFLHILTRNRLIDFIRRQTREKKLVGRLEDCLRERGLSSHDPGPSEIAEAGELWERILDLCSPEHRPILEFRRAGYTLAEIAAHTGLHPDSIRRILRTLSRRITA
jgi:RNA polymerase sigma factor (sigma-70 family)